MLERDVAEGIHRVEDSYTNWYIVEDGERVTLVDAGLPTSWESLTDSLAQLGHTPADVEALVLTHAHFDHIGFAERARAELGIPVFVHENDVPLTHHPLQYSRERSPLQYPLRWPGSRRVFAAYLKNRAFFPPPIHEVRRYRAGDPALPVPGAPEILFTPGHTLGHCALHFRDRGAVIAGDAIVTLDPYTGTTGPRLVARAATADSERALDTLVVLAATDAERLLPGHGEPWTGGVREAVERARAAGVR
jgi:glyoxylase-like metal-dependent hydrolase (beta-lactamase superfamily II)